jgi:hypoxanthine phosphoribosyltransferase
MTNGSSAWRPEDDIEEVLITEAELGQRVTALGEQISGDYRGHSLVLLGVLKGAVMFLVDLARQIRLPLELDFMATSSYGASTQSSGVVRILKDLDESVEGKHVLIVEDIIDSGLTLSYILRSLQARQPASIKICGLLVKNRPRDSELTIDYVGFEIPDRFVVGYGLDYAEVYRNLPFIGVLKPERYRDSDETASP